VLGDRRAADRKPIGKFAHRARALGQLFEDGSAGAVTHRIPDTVGPSVSLHEP
jgi:hypothetical protein